MSGRTHYKLGAWPGDLDSLCNRWNVRPRQCPDNISRCVSQRLLVRNAFYLELVTSSLPGHGGHVAVVTRRRVNVPAHLQVHSIRSAVQIVHHGDLVLFKIEFEGAHLCETSETNDSQSCTSDLSDVA